MGRKKISPACLPNPSSQCILRYHSSWHKHCHPMFMPLKQVWSETWLICVNEGECLPIYNCWESEAKQNVRRLKFAVLKNIHLQIHSNCLDTTRYNFPFQNNDTETSETPRFQIVFCFKCSWRAEKHFSYYVLA